MKNKFKFLINILMSNFIESIMMDDISLCDDLIDYYHKSNEYKQQVVGSNMGRNKNSTDVLVFPHSNDKTIRKYIDFLFSGLDSYRQVYDSFNYTISIKEPFNIQHYKPNEGFLNWHCERFEHQTNQRALVFMTYLNDVTDGGETEWLYQKVKFKPKKGLTVFWPTDFTHLHKGLVSPTQSKTIVTGWFHFLDHEQNYEILLEKYQKQENELKEKITVKS